MNIVFIMIVYHLHPYDTKDIMVNTCIHYVHSIVAYIVYNHQNLKFEYLHQNENKLNIFI